MYNYLMLVGTVTKDIELKELADNKKVARIELAVARDFKNQDGNYDTDFLKVAVWDFLAELASETLKKGSKIGIKGRVYPHTEQLASGAYVPINELVGERIFFLDKVFSDEQVVEEEDLDASKD